jgi:hypothetical protein
VVEEADLLLELEGVVPEVVLPDDVLPFDPLDVVEEVLAVGQHFGRVVEIDSDHVVAQGISDPVLRGVVDPLLHCYVYRLHLTN